MDPFPAELDEFKRDLAALINRHSLDTATQTPDFILAEFLVVTIAGFGIAMRQTQQWLVS